MTQPRETLARLAGDGKLALLRDIRRGLEKESLRVSEDGQLSLAPHPRTLGSALTHERITTDFSEALLEFITPPMATPEEALKSLDEVHRYTYANIDGEQLWVNSMPCALGNDSDIPVARYGSSHSATLKTVYRLGLSLRYGRTMQTIAGLHYNFSVPDSLWQWLLAQEGSEEDLQAFKTRRYFDLIRNFRRNYWLLIFLFGAAPAVCRSFVKGRAHKLEPVGEDQHSLHLPHATSLRMGDLGYSSNAQESLVVCYNDLPSYLSTLCAAISRPWPEYHKLGTRDADGNYQQLSTGLLQIENEFYSAIRPKNPARSGETALSALDSRGVEYIEVRCLDLDPFAPLGIDAVTMRLVDCFLLYCLLSPSPQTDEADFREVQANQRKVVEQGLDPELVLSHNGKPEKLRDWGEALLAKLLPIADMLDTAHDSGLHREAVSQQLAKVRGEVPTPAARILQELRQTGTTYFQWALSKAGEHRDYFHARPLDAAQQAEFEQLAEASLQQQARIEADDQGSFEDFLSQYYAQYIFCQR
ncbi:glutamate--cysteine ligase [Biformimicrobium ophioploci]|uniref:Glutamate--cysteine ligase n=1 Tax=Biformimicrobium ophioploci TaxID=3036711 RepID=A0ABQ6LVU3_9GAMM|nr:glutamate--cysteine ligase [Microbulbifer sp. NKW57]GMG86200.1 glutamate--cysteine ligase [Microbulbifer sp. NKW57]